MLQTEFERKQIEWHKKRITHPLFIRNEENMRFCYQYDGKNRYIIFESRDMAADFLLKQRLIDKVVYLRHGNPVMYKEHFEIEYTSARKTSFRQKPIYKQFSWEEITFSETQILNYCARAEYEGLGGIIGHCEALIIPFTTFLAA